MDYLQGLLRRARVRLFLVIVLGDLILIAAFVLVHTLLKLSVAETSGLLLVLSLLLAALITIRYTSYLLQPLAALWQTILHLSPEGSAAAPNLESLTFGRELVANLTANLYQLVTVADKVKTETAAHLSELGHNFIAQNLPLPLLVLDAQETIKFANQAAVNYIGTSASDLIGKNVYMVLDMSFPSEKTFDTWLKAVKQSSATAASSWERVRLNVRDNHPTLLFDLAAYYNRDNPAGNATIMVLFDHTKAYSQDDQAISFVALTVHELRTPLTLLRGYIEVFEEELKGQVNQELSDFLEKMHAQAEQLTAFVNNILNVARVDDDQLELNLEEADWSSTLKSVIETLSIRAKVRGISLNCQLAKNLPPVGVDRLSIQEVVNNLIDNAIKYSGNSKQINIATYQTKDGMIETTVQDFGLGIPSSIMPNLFTKFYRDHRNRAQIGGTGLGLYLSKAIIKAHGGNLWVRSQEGNGSTFGFTILPYAALSEEAKQNGNLEITRSAHGWIKNHSLYRR